MAPTRRICLSFSRRSALRCRWRQAPAGTPRTGPFGLDGNGDGELSGIVDGDGAFVSRSVCCGAGSIGGSAAPAGAALELGAIVLDFPVLWCPRDHIFVRYPVVATVLDWLGNEKWFIMIPLVVTTFPYLVTCVPTSCCRLLVYSVGARLEAAHWRDDGASSLTAMSGNFIGYGTDGRHSLFGGMPEEDYTCRRASGDGRLGPVLRSRAVHSMGWEASVVLLGFWRLRYKA